MEDQEKQDYKKAFNEGYTIAKELPNGLEIIAGLKSENIRIDGLKAGAEQHVYEVNRDRLPNFGSYLENLKFKEDKQMDHDLDKD